MVCSRTVHPPKTRGLNLCFCFFFCFFFTKPYLAALWRLQVILRNGTLSARKPVLNLPGENVNGFLFFDNFQNLQNLTFAQVEKRQLFLHFFFFIPFEKVSWAPRSLKQAKSISMSKPSAEIKFTIVICVRGFHDCALITLWINCSQIL